MNPFSFLGIKAVSFGIDRIELRRRNLIEPDAMPFTNGVGVTYDSGDYPACMAEALDAADVPVSSRAPRRAEDPGRRRAAG